MADQITDPSFLGQALGPIVDGDTVPTDDSFVSVNPATGLPLVNIGVSSAKVVDLAVSAALAAGSGAWRTTSPSMRARLLARLADLVDLHRDELAALEVADNGKPMREALSGDIPFAAEVLRYYSGWPTKVVGSSLPNSIPNMLAFTSMEPVGVVAAITPWNFPLLQLVYKLGPALATGCTVVVKPSELASVTTLRLAELVHEAGFPPGVVNVVPGGPEVGAELVAHPGVAKIAFTGQTSTGQAIMRASSMGLKRLTLELGGKSPHILAANADLDRSLAAAFRGIFYNQGQVCVAGSRLLVHRSIAESVVNRLTVLAEETRVGPGADPATDMGPLISASQLRRVQEAVESARTEGASIAAGGDAATVAGYEGGFYFRPTVITDVQADMYVAREEIFGPVLSVMTWEDDEDLLRLANGASYGLAAGLWSSDVSWALAMAARLEAGTVWINSYGRFDVAVPFGGRKASGFGRELGEEALHAYLAPKSIWLDTSVRGQPRAGGL